MRRGAVTQRSARILTVIAVSIAGVACSGASAPSPSPTPNPSPPVDARTPPPPTPIALPVEWTFELTAHPDAFETINGIAEAADGGVWVADAAKHRILKLGAGGELEAALGGRGSEAGMFDLEWPLMGGPLIAGGDLAVDGAGNLYVADTGNVRIQKFDPSGRFVGAFGERASTGSRAGNGMFARPIGVAVDGAGIVYVTDDRGADAIIQRFDATGKFVSQWGRLGTDGLTRGIVTAALSPDGRWVYLADYEEAYLQRFVAADGHLDGRVAEGIEQPVETATDADGNVYVVAKSGPTILELDPEGEPVAVYEIEGGSETAILMTLDVGIDGSIFVFDDSTDTVYKLRR